ncbi:MAG TPA: DUF3313 family protein [Steroidobacteraceae bacterium]|nr:DUF3313 family protein [Steroidobacteraceae bacterium]
MRNVIRAATILSGVLALLSACVVNAPPVAENTPDGLVRVQSKQVDTVYAKPGVSLARYKRVMLDSVELAFKLDWEKRHPEVSESDVTRIRSQGSAVFYEIFSSALTLNNGYPLATQPGADVLRVTASITELDVAATPGSTGTQRMYVVSPSDLTLFMELRDSTTGALLVRAIDREKGRAVGNLQVEGAVSNSAEARKALEMWAGLLRGALDNARAMN